MRAWLTRLLVVVGLAFAALAGGALPASADAGEPPFDPGEDWTLTSSREDPATDPAAECSTASEWLWSDGEREMTFYLVPCEDGDAASGIYEWLAIDGEPVGGAAGEGEHTLWAQDRVIRAWIADAGSEAPLAVLTVTCASADQATCVSDTWRYAETAMRMLPGGIDGVDTPGFTIGAIVLSLLVPLVFIAAVLLPSRIVTGIARVRYQSTSTSPRYHDVTGMVRKARSRRRIRLALWSTIGLLIMLGLTSWATWDTGTYAGLLIICAIPGLVLLIGYRTFLKPSAVERGRRNLSGQGAEAALGSMLSVLSYALVVLLLVVYVLASNYGSMSVGWPSLDGSDVRRMDLPLLGGLRPLVQSMGDTVPWLGLLLTIPALALIAAIDGLGQRLRTASLDDALAQDDRPHYLYLRSFDEDTLSLAGQLRRRGLISVIAMRRKVRFEEVLVRQLSATGPVIAIAPPGSNMPPIGAARASFSNDEWQQHVHRYAETARAVVLSATPGEIRQGYGWELDLIANRIGHQRVLVVLGPWRLSSLRRRWTQFCMAVSAVPFFAPITMPWVPDGIHVLAHSTQRGWQGWGARRRLDWTYAVAIDQATREYLPDWS